MGLQLDELIAYDKRLFKISFIRLTWQNELHYKYNFKQSSGNLLAIILL
jgi:hypothetical protein